jgi:hypothetical protein
MSVRRVFRVTTVPSDVKSAQRVICSALVFGRRAIERDGTARQLVLQTASRATHMCSSGKRRLFSFIFLLAYSCSLDLITVYIRRSDVLF